MSYLNTINEIREDTESSVEKYVRSDVSLAVSVSTIVGILGAIMVDWTILPLMLCLAYMLVGISVTWEWNQSLRDSGMVPRRPFQHVTATGFIPAVLSLTVFHFNAWGFGLSAIASFILFIVYEITIYTIGFSGLDEEKIYFKHDPFEGDQRVFHEDVYIPRLEEKALERAERD